MSSGLQAALHRGIESLGLALDASQAGRLLDYLALIQKWNKVYNLTAVRSPDDMLTHHILDSLAVVGPLLRETGGQPTRLLDVGSGAGLPGVVIAICCRQIQVDCVDAVAKKAAFVQQVSASLQLPNLRGIHARVETLTDRYDVVASRAFASLSDFLSLSGSVLAVDGGLWLAQKGRDPAPEIASLPAGVQVFHVEQLTVPGLDAQRCIVWLRRAPAFT
jgi:16S rRNA (guanine527-N7)-methyltransferase